VALPKLYAVPKVPYLRRDTPEALPNSRYYADFRDPRDKTKDPRGKRCRPYLGTNLKVAKIKLLDLLRDAEIMIGEEGIVENGPYTLAEAQERCMADLVAGGLQEPTRKRYVSCDRNALARFGEPLFIHQITKSAVKAWFADRARDASPTTANRDLGRLAQVLDWAIEAEWLKSANPARRIRKNKEIAKSEPFTDEEWERMVAAAEADPELLDMVVFAGECGARQGELFRLSFSTNIRPGGLWLKSREARKRSTAPTKTKKGRVIPITPIMAAILDRQRERHPGSDLVFPNTKGRVWHRGNFRKYRWRPLFERAGISEEKNFHTFRHDFCSRLRQGGVDIIDIAALAGHENLSTSRIYSHHYAGHLEAKMAARVRPQFRSGTPNGDTQEGEGLVLREPEPVWHRT
jgi:integrase